MWQAARQDGLTCGLEDVSVTCSATHPYAVTFATADWLHLCGFADHEVCGKTLAIIQGPASDQGLLRTMMASIRAGEVPLVTENLINYDKQRQPFVHTVTIATVADESGTTTHFHAKSSAIKLFNRGAHCASVDVTTASVSIAGDGASSRCERLVQSVPSYSLPMSRHTAAAAVPRALRCPPGWGVHEVVTQATAPFAVVHASPGWLSTCGYRLDEITGKDLSCIQGVATDAAVVAELMRACRAGVGVRGLQLVNYDKQVRPFLHELSVELVSGAGGAAFLRATSREVRRLTVESRGDRAGDRAGGRADGKVAKRGHYAPGLRTAAA